MQAPRGPLADITGLNWSQLPGSATEVAAAPDGTLWVLSTQPSGADKYIWHYASGSWTNISGLADQLAVAPNGTLYAVNSGGGTYAYGNGSWTALGGGAKAITIAADGSIYVISNASSGDQSVWHNVNGSWSQVSGSGSVLAASWDTGGPYVPLAGSILPGGTFILNTAGQIWYENTDHTFAEISGAARGVAPTKSGGLFALGSPASTAGNALYYYDLDSNTWSARNGAGVSLSTDGSTLYVVGASSAIYASPVTPVAPALHPMTWVPNGALNTVTEYAATANGNVPPANTIGGSNTALSDPDGAALDTNNALYVSNISGGPDANGSITVYPPNASGNVAPVQIIEGAGSLNNVTGLSAPTGIAVDYSGQIYATNAATNSVTIYSAGATGNVPPKAAISGSNTQIDYPTGLYVDCNGEVYVSNYNANSITEYRAGSTGNVAPNRIIQGADTNLFNPWGVVSDSLGNVYVANSGAGTVTVYGPAGSGNVAPQATITNSGTDLFGPDGITLDQWSDPHEIIVANNIGASLTYFASYASGAATPEFFIHGTAGLQPAGGLPGPSLTNCRP